MRRDSLDRLSSQLKELLGHDEALLQQRKEEVSAAEQVLADAKGALVEAKSAFARTHERAEASQRAARTAEKLLKRISTQAGDGAGNSEDEVNDTLPTIVQLICSCVRARSHVTTREIVDYVVSHRPGTNRDGISPELSRLVRSGRIVRIDRGTYRAGRLVDV